MYIKRDREVRAEREITYLSLAHNIWKTAPHRREASQTFHHLDTGLGSRSSPPLLGGPRSFKPGPFRPARSEGDDSSGCVLLRWELGIDQALKDFQEKHRVEFEGIVFGMVLNRIVDPLSKLACNEWLKEDAPFNLFAFSGAGQGHHHLKLETRKFAPSAS